MIRNERNKQISGDYQHCQHERAKYRLQIQFACIGRKRLDIDLRTLVSQFRGLLLAGIRTVSKISSPTWRGLFDLLQMFGMIFESFWGGLRDLSLTKRVRVPRLEAIFLRCCRVAYAFRAVCLENHGVERASCSRHNCDAKVKHPGQ
jgi:hypothetical protein